MRRPVVATVAVLVALTSMSLLAGCGGGAEEQTQNADPAPATGGVVTSPPATATAAATGTVDMVFEPFPADEDDPKKVTENLEADQPMLLFFYDSSERLSKDMRKQIDAAIEDSAESVDLIAYDLGEYTDVLEGGTINVDAESLKADPEAMAAVQLATRLGVTQAHTIVISDSQDYVIYRHRGFVDSALLGRQLSRVEQ